MSTREEAYIYDQLNPDEKCFRGGGRNKNRNKWRFAPMPEHLLKQAPKKISGKEHFKKQDENLKNKGF